MYRAQTTFKILQNPKIIIKNNEWGKFGELEIAHSCYRNNAGNYEFSLPYQKILKIREQEQLKNIIALVDDSNIGRVNKIERLRRNRAVATIKLKLLPMVFEYWDSGYHGIIEKFSEGVKIHVKLKNCDGYFEITRDLNSTRSKYYFEVMDVSCGELRKINISKDVASYFPGALDAIKKIENRIKSLQADVEKITKEIKRETEKIQWEPLSFSLFKPNEKILDSLEINSQDFYEIADTTKEVYDEEILEYLDLLMFERGSGDAEFVSIVEITSLLLISNEVMFYLLDSDSVFLIESYGNLFVSKKSISRSLSGIEYVKRFLSKVALRGSGDKSAKLLLLQKKKKSILKSIKKKKMTIKHLSEEIAAEKVSLKNLCEDIRSVENQQQNRK
ncbi:hypothetical protein [Sulfurimonas sp.]